MKKFMLVVLAILGSSLVAQAQERKISATVETTTSSVVSTSSKSLAEFVILYPTRWVTSEQMMTIEGAPAANLTGMVKFTLAGSAENPAMTLDTDTGVQYRSEGLRSYAGSNKHYEVAAAYRVKRISFVGGYMRFSSRNVYENSIPYGFDGSGLVTTYNEKQTYSGFELGARTNFRFGNLNLEPGFMFYPKVSRNFTSHQNYLGRVYNNNMNVNEGRRMGVQLTGKARYDLVRHMGVTFSYNYQLVRTTNTLQFGGPAREDLKTRSALVGLQIGF